MNRIVLGGAQLGLPYGILHQGDAIDHAEVAQILNVAYAAGIDQIDTAIAYGASETMIGENSHGRFSVISKLPPIPHDCHDVRGWVEKQVHASLSRLKAERLEGLLLHHPQDLTGPFGSSLYHAISRLQEEKSINRFGISIYSPHELDGLIDNFKIDIVQTPFNVFDQRIVSSLEKLSSLGIEVHARSIFLQGILIAKPSDRPTYFKKWAKDFDTYETWIYTNEMSYLTACLTFVLSFSEISKIILGVYSSQQLHECIEAVKFSRFLKTKPNEVTDFDLLDPRMWNLNN